MSDIGFTVFPVATNKLRSQHKWDETARTPLSRWTVGHWINTMNPKDYAIKTCDDAIHCPKPWTLVDSGYVMHEIGMGQNCRQPGNCRTQDPVRQMARPNRQNVIISREKDPSRQLIWRAEWGRAVRKRWTFAFFWPSANYVSWRKGGVDNPGWQTGN